MPSRNKGKHWKISDETKMKHRLSVMGSKNGMWKGDNVSLPKLHEWVRNHLPKPELCEICHEEPPYDLANKGIYDRDFKNWYYLCRKCHMNSDGRMNNLKQFNVEQR